MLELNKAYNMDCMEGMRRFPDNFFDLAVVDPPYGGAGQEFKGANRHKKDIPANERGGDNASDEQAEHGRQGTVKKS